MTNKQDELERVVLQAVANDYEEFATIVQDVARWMSKIWDLPNKQQIERALMKSIADKNVNAYETSDELQQFIATQADPQKIGIQWFYITEQGRQRMQRLEDEEI
jgi:hypothetical protein